MEPLIIVVFIVGYALIAFEHSININKTATALITGALCWAIYALYAPSASFVESEHYKFFANSLNTAQQQDQNLIYSLFIKSELSKVFGETASILFFLLGAMTIVELIDTHQGFRFITDRIKTKDMRSLLWIVCLVSFFLSSILDNLTTAIVMVSLTRKLIPEKETRLFFCGMIIIAANAGGAWSPIGDVTTTMLWIGGQISTVSIMKSTFIPSLVCLLVPMIYLSFKLKGNVGAPPTGSVDRINSTGGKIMLIVGVGALMAVPVFKTITHLPPYMGILLGLSIIWIVSEFINPELDVAQRQKLSASSAISRTDIPSVLFFMGILLAVGALESMQTLHHLSEGLSAQIGDTRIIITLIGVISAIIDNVPLVAASMGMYSIDIFPMDHLIWKYLAYCAGTGGSMLIIGSAAGVAVMGLEKIDFIWYVKKITLLATMGYAGGAMTYFLIN